MFAIKNVARAESLDKLLLLAVDPLGGPHLSFLGRCGLAPRRRLLVDAGQEVL